MKLLRAWIRRLRGTVRPTPTDPELDRELQLHLELAEQDLIRQGVEPTQAKREARLRAGGPAQAMEACRDQRSLPWLEDFWRDLRHGARSLARSPSFTTIAVLTLALGIGANTAIFSIVSGVLLRPLGYPNPEQLMYLTTQFPALNFPEFWVSPPEYREFRDMNQSFASVGAYRIEEGNLSTEGRPRRVRAALVDNHLLETLAIPPARGRFFTEAETFATTPAAGPELDPQAAPVAILSHELWQSAFGGAEMLGETIKFNGVRGEVIGIMPPGADVLSNGVELWLPLRVQPGRQNRGSHFLYVVGRLKDNITPESAQAELDTLIETWADRVNLPENTHVFVPLKANEEGFSSGHILQMEPAVDQVLDGADRSIWLLQAGVGFVLLIGCANLASLLLARAETRRRELAVRAAIGASRGRLVRQFLAEGALLSVVGASLGLVLAKGAVEALVRAFPTSLPRMNEVSLDSRTLLFTLAVATATGIFFGLAPLLHSGARGLANGIKEAATRGVAGVRRQGFRRSLVVSEIALAVVLLVGAGLMIRTVRNLTDVDAGFDRARLVTFSISLSPADYPRAKLRATLFQRLLDEFRAVPGVEAATAMSGLPPERPLNANDTEISNYTAPPEGPYENIDYYQEVMSDYFETMGIPIVRGRAFRASDAASNGMITVVNETLARTYWPGMNPLGQQLKPCCGDRAPWFTVIGVAKDVKQGGVSVRTGTEMYFFVDQAANLPSRAIGPQSMNIVLRTTLEPAALASTIDQVVREADSAVPIVGLREMEQVFAESIRQPRLLAQLLAAFAGLALLLAAIGAYGVLSYMVAERRREIGVRMALGAQRSRVLTQVVRQGLTLTVIGLLVGLAGAFGLGRLVTSLLFDVEPTDVGTLATTAATMTAVAAISSLMPAWRAARVDPNLALREE